MYGSSLLSDYYNMTQTNEGRPFFLTPGFRRPAFCIGVTFHSLQSQPPFRVSSSHVCSVPTDWSAGVIQKPW